MESKFEIEYRLYEKNWWWFVGRRNLLTKLLKDIKLDTKVLDIGCGSGENTKILKNINQYYGIDISKNALNDAHTKEVNNLCLGTANALPFRSNSFGLVLFLDVLEHLDNEETAIQEVCRVLTKDGTCIVSVPAFRFLWSGHDVVNQHMKRYTKSELRGILVSNKFVIKRITYWNFLLFFPLALIRVIKKVVCSQQQPKSHFRILPNCINKLLVSILSIENALILHGINLPVGISVVCICKKKEVKNMTKNNRWWKLKYMLLGKIPEICPYCGGEVVDRGFEGHNRRHQCRSCQKILVTDYGL